MEEHGHGLVGILAQDTARFSMFAASLTEHNWPARTRIKWMIGHAIADSMNKLVDAMLEDDADWIWILGDDHQFGSNLLDQLLEADRDIIVPLCLTRMPPFRPVLFTGFENGSKRRWPINLADYPYGGLVKLHSAGTAGMLVRREVFEQMERPWFEIGQVGSEHLGEDVYFCDKARELGYEIWGDLDAPMGHITSASVWPYRDGEQWSYGFMFQGGMKVAMPFDAWNDAEALAEANQ